jgi:hypothetical protein
MNPDLTTSTAPTIDTFDPSAIDGISYKCGASGFSIWRFFKAPTSGGPYTLIFRCATWWRQTIPGGSFQSGTNEGWITMTFEAGEEMRDVQVVEILKAGSSAGTWVVAP